MSTLTIKVYEADNATHVGDIERLHFRSAKFGDINSEAGAWEIVLPRRAKTSDEDPTLITNPAIGLLTIGRIVRFLTSPTGEDSPVERFTGLVEDLTIVPIAPKSLVGETWTVKGRGLLAIFDKVRVRPDAGMDNQPFHPTRWFNHSADRLRDDDPSAPQGIWPAAYGQLPNYDTDNYFGRPKGFIDTAGPDGDGPEWLWDQDTRTAFADAGVVYFRQRFTLDDDGPVEFQFAADDEGELWVDGIPVCRSEGVYLGGCVKGTVRMTAGEHLLSAVGRNLNALRAGVVYAGWTVTNGMPDTLVVRSDSAAAICLPYPDDPPGFTPTEVIRLVVDEVQSLPVPRLADVTFSFISASDTDSVEIDEVTDITCHAPGDSILTLLEMLGETYLDISMTPDSLEMNAWIRGTRGADLSGSVAFTKGTCRRVTYEVTGSERATVALVSGTTFAPFEVDHADASTFDIYEEVALDFGDASRSAAGKFALDYLNLVSQARRGVTIELVPNVGPVPYEDFNVGDTISIPGVTGGAEDHRVVAIGATLGPDSILRWTVDLDQPRLLLEERLSSLMRRQMAGTAGGRTLLPNPQAPSFVANTAGTEDVNTWQWDGPLDEIQLYKNATPITGATITVASGNTEKVTLTDAARKFVMEADKITITAGGGDASPEWVEPQGRFIQEMRVTADAVSDAYTITVSIA